MLMMPNIVSTPIRSNSFKSASATVIFTQKLPDNGVECIRLLCVTEVARVANHLQPGTRRYFIPQWGYLILCSPDQERRHSQIAQHGTRVRFGKRYGGEFVTGRSNLRHNRNRLAQKLIGGRAAQ